MIAVKCSMSNIPRLEMLKVEPVNSSGLSFRSRARPASSRDSALISRRLFWSAFRITGVMSPSSIATAIPIWAWRHTRIRSSIHQALQAGCWISAVATALIRMSLNETLPSGPSAFSASRASAVRSMSTSIVR